MAKSRDYKERQVDEKYHKAFVAAHVVRHTVATFLPSALIRGSNPLLKELKMSTNTGENISVWCSG